MIFQNGEENNNNNIDVCRVIEGLKEKKNDACGHLGKEETK